MPVKPENRARYPKDWPVLAVAVKERAGWCCEGSPAYPDCRVPHHDVGYRDEGGVWHCLKADGEAQDVWEIQFSMGDLCKVIRIVLTVGHLDHQPENCAPENLRAWCQRCHLFYDRHHHAATAAATRKAGKADGDLFA